MIFLHFVQACAERDIFVLLKGGHSVNMKYAFAGCSLFVTLYLVR